VNLIENISLKPYNTFQIDVSAKYFLEFTNIDELEEILNSTVYKENKSLIIGGGSNLLLCKNFDGVILKNSIKGISIIKETENHIYVKANAGESWHEFVMYCIENNFAGVENLSLIPGCVGASPMQNIGAYGVEIKDVLHEVEALNIPTNQLEYFNNEDCKFGYRESIFKNTLKDKYIITSVVFCLNKKAILNISYGAIKDELAKKQIQNPNIKDISDAVIAIRSSKLPDPKILGNAGSFFKNPEIDEISFKEFHEANPTAPYYELTNNISEKQYKIPAGWLIEQCGWKGKVIGNTGSHKDQALVLVNYGNAEGEEIYQLALAIQQSVKEKFNITISPEVNIYR
jgi:UDP-N-acetylmuramate dehydrogenase